MNEFESIILKNLTHSGEYFSKVMPLLESKYFPEIGQQQLFSLIKQYYTDYQQIPELTELVAMVRSVPNSTTREEIVKTLREVNTKEEIKNVEFLSNETVKWIKDVLYLEALRIGSEGLMEKSDEKKLKAQEILEIRSKISLDSDLGLDFDDIQTMIEYYSERLIGVKTQHKELNKRLGPGFIPGTLSVILAASGVGKSLLKTDLVSGMIKEGKNVLLVSMEMQDREIMKRVHANAMDLPINSLIDLSKTEGELEQIRRGDDRTPGRDIVTKEQVISAYNKMKTSGKCGKFFVKDYPSGTFSALMLEQLVQSFKDERGIEFDVIFLDYLGIMKSDRVSPSAGLYSYIKSIAEEVRGTAQKLNVPIISANQLNRSALEGDVRDADNSNVSDSMGTVMTADFMLFLLQNEEMKERGEMVLKCTKNRFTGRTDTWLMNIDYDHMRFSDMTIQNPTMELSDMISGPGNQLSEDFGIITAKKQEEAEKFAVQEVNDIFREDTKKMIESDKESKTSKTLDDLDDIYAELGI